MRHPGSRKQVAIGFLGWQPELQGGVVWDGKGEPTGYLPVFSLLPTHPPSQEHFVSALPAPIQMLPWKPRCSSSVSGTKAIDRTLAVAAVAD